MRKVRVLSHIGKAISVTIYVMLFFLGVKIGADRNILANLSTLGVQALLLALAGAMGSVFFAALLYRFFFRKKVKCIGLKRRDMSTNFQEMIFSR